MGKPLKVMEKKKYWNCKLKNSSDLWEQKEHPHGDRRKMSIYLDSGNTTHEEPCDETCARSFTHLGASAQP